MTTTKIPKIGQSIKVLDADNYFHGPSYVNIVILSEFKQMLEGPWIAWGKIRKGDLDLLVSVILYKSCSEQILYPIQIGGGAECNFTEEETIEAAKKFRLNI